MSLTLKHDFLAPNWDDDNDQLVAAIGTALDSARTGATANARDYNNVLKTLTANEPVFPLARRVENLCTYSNDMSQWTNTRSTDTQNAGTDPDGGNTANSLNDGTANNSHFQTISVTGIKKYEKDYLLHINESWN